MTDAPDWWTTPLWHALPNDEELMRTLIGATCPAPCVGWVNDAGWHRGCISRAEEAFRVLRGWSGKATP